MIFGMPFGCPFGRPNEWLDYYGSESLGGDLYRVYWMAKDGCDGFYQVCLNWAKVNRPIFCTAGVEASCVVRTASVNPIISLIQQGYFGGQNVRITDALHFELSSGAHGSNRFKLNVAAVPLLYFERDGGQLSNLVLAGLRRGNNIESVENRPSWGHFTAKLASVDDVHTLTLYVGGRDMVRGSRTGNGTIQLSGGGIVGSVDLSFDGGFDNADVFVRWPAEYRVYVKPGAAFADGEFDPKAATEFYTDGSVVYVLIPGGHTFAIGQKVKVSYTGEFASKAYLNRVGIIFEVGSDYIGYTAAGPETLDGDGTGTVTPSPAGIIKDDAASNFFSYSSYPIKQGNIYYIVVHQVGDDGNEKTNIESGGKAVTTQTIPDAPSKAIYVSGGSDETAISFTAPTSAPDSYHLYDSGETGVMNTDTVSDTYTTDGNHTLPGLSGSFTGTRYVFVRSVVSGIEELSLKVLILKYKSGVRLSDAPDDPIAFSGISITGRSLTVPYSISKSLHSGNVASVEIYLYKKPAGVDYASPAATSSITQTFPIFNGTITGTAASNGVYYYQLRTKNADGVTSLNTVEYGPVQLSITAAFADPLFTLEEVF